LSADHPIRPRRRPEVFAAGIGLWCRPVAADSRDVFRRALAVDDATWCHGRGWALQSGLRAAAYSADNPVLGGIGRYTLTEVQADFKQTRL
jgi:hypothetical protein